MESLRRSLSQACSDKPDDPVNAHSPLPTKRAPLVRRGWCHWGRTQHHFVEAQVKARQRAHPGRGLQIDQSARGGTSVHRGVKATRVAHFVMHVCGAASVTTRWWNVGRSQQQLAGRSRNFSTLSSDTSGTRRA